MATQAFEYALEDADLVSKAVNTLRGLNSSTVARQNTIRDLQILEAVLRGVQEVSLASASEDTLRKLQYCSQFCRPPLSRFLRSLKELKPDLCHAPICEEPLIETNEAPAWATKLEGEVAALQGSVGKGLWIIDLLLRIEAMQFNLATSATLPGDLQRIADNLQEFLHYSGQHRFGPGHCYRNIQTNGGHSHYGDKYFFNGTPPSALVEALSKNFELTAGMLHIDHSVSIGEDLKAMLPHGFPSTHVVNDNTSKPPTTTVMEVQSLSSQSTQPSATELNKLLLQCLLDMLRTKLNVILAMLLWTIPDFRIFIRSLNTFARQPSMLLDSNITLVDILSREISLPYQWFRRWPHMLAHLRYEFREVMVKNSRVEAIFFQFQDSSLSQCERTTLSSNQWEDLVRPGSHIVMTLLIQTRRAHSQASPADRIIYTSSPRATDQHGHMSRFSVSRIHRDSNPRPHCQSEAKRSERARIMLLTNLLDN